MSKFILMSKKTKAKELRTICSNRALNMALYVVKKQIKKEKATE